MTTSSGNYITLALFAQCHTVQLHMCIVSAATVSDFIGFLKLLIRISCRKSMDTSTVPCIMDRTTNAEQHGRAVCAARALCVRVRVVYLERSSSSAYPGRFNDTKALL